MGSDPLVCCICPSHIPGFIEQAARCFHSQTYPRKELIAVDTSRVKQTIGAIRNNLVSVTPKGCLIAHWDADDWSAPQRLAGQVAFMQSSGADIVGYSDLPFYDTVKDRVLLYRSGMVDYSPGTALMYKRSVWEQVPFPDHKEGEDHGFQFAAKLQGFRIAVEPCRVRMVATLHASNTTNTRATVDQQLAQDYQPMPNFTLADAELDAAVRRIVGSNPWNRFPALQPTSGGNFRIY